MSLSWLASFVTFALVPLCPARCRWAPRDLFDPRGAFFLAACYGWLFALVSLGNDPTNARSHGRFPASVGSCCMTPPQTFFVLWWAPCSEGSGPPLSLRYLGFAPLLGSIGVDAFSSPLQDLIYLLRWPCIRKFFNLILCYPYFVFNFHCSSLCVLTYGWITLQLGLLCCFRPALVWAEFSQS